MSFGKKEKCCGCTACQSICCKMAITMQEDKEGFLYPQIDESLCNNCGLCKKVCPIYEGYTNKCGNKLPKVFAATHKNEDLRRSSQSGGLFYALAERIIEDNGTVYGCGYSNNMVVHMKVETRDELKRLQGSKYVQSEIGDSFINVYNDLLNNKKVLFSATSCHIAGLYKYLEFKRMNIDNLYTCDLVCHGVPSPLIYKENLKYIETLHNSKIQTVNLRDKKRYGWHSSIETYKLENGKVVESRLFNELFYSNMILRPYCGVCEFSSIYKPADITMGDYWGIEKAHKDLIDDNWGISLALVNTKKGADLIKKCDLNLLESSVDKCIQPNLEGPSHISIQRSKFWNDYFNNGYNYILKKYTPNGGIPFKIKRKILKYLKKW
ncbi:MAG: Coenzyme F420 hydrogenase/dehydrogenase, beta subunit C-terminal domain [Terrisporobacter othiniensis]|uniref:Coenzyme F420 hydrogenase/dehydrogenase, beta subunit C-terminal domain n=1 Tax=Terrisporobacter othiniensis TaxID=1577792 RepID=UPI00290DE491|nr:Coenzyme F420 hydrogenase/dehydrogenase, beta subunit C-terminal domain [Terrisporobacter othiniensis]MDU6983199.1 Coenzyme F420 hydrogenase/dehydrogenase, beta subunit C-terminal domain [Terrisporobacter othiniensis]